MPLTEGAAAILSSAASAGVSGALSVGSGLFGKKKAKKYNLELQQDQFDKNMEMARWQNDRNRENAEWVYNKNLEQWNRENEYNSPAAQMQRYKEAGLNPNLMYTSAGSNTAASSPTMSEIEQNGYPMSGGSGVGDSMPSVAIPDLFHEYMNLKTQKLQQDSIQQNINLQKSQEDSFKAMAFLNNLKGLQLNSGAPYWSSNAKYDNLGKQMALDLKKETYKNIVFNNEELNPLRKAAMLTDNFLKQQNYMFNEDANPLKLLAMKLNANHLKLSNDGLKLDNDFKKDRNQYSGEAFKFDNEIKREIHFGKKLDNDIKYMINDIINNPDDHDSWSDVEKYIMAMFRGWSY